MARPRGPPSAISTPLATHCPRNPLVFGEAYGRGGLSPGCGRPPVRGVRRESELAEQPACGRAVRGGARRLASLVRQRRQRQVGARDVEARTRALECVERLAETLPRLLPMPAGAGDVAERALGQANGPGEPGLEADLDPLHRLLPRAEGDRKSTRLNSSHANISYAV